MITASVVLYKTALETIARLLGSLKSCGQLSTLYIIDNSPDDRHRILAERHKGQPRIRYIHSANVGYGAAHNIAIAEAIRQGADYHVVLNPDVSFEPGLLEALAAFMDGRPSAAYVLPRVVYPDGSQQYLCRLLPNPLDLLLRRLFSNTRLAERANARYELRMSGYNTIMNPPCLSGCFMFMRTSFLAAHNLFFDERFFMYFEDFDLIRRIHSKAETLYYPCAVIVHECARESLHSKKMLAEHVKSMIRYFNKWGWFFDSERRKMNQKILADIRMEAEQKNNAHGGGHKQHSPFPLYLNPSRIAPLATQAEAAA